MVNRPCFLGISTVFHSVVRVVLKLTILVWLLIEVLPTTKSDKSGEGSNAFLSTSPLAKTAQNSISVSEKRFDKPNSRQPHGVTRSDPVVDKVMGSDPFLHMDY